VDVLHGEGLAAGKDFPTSLVLGSDAYQLIKADLYTDIENLEAWKDVSCSTDFEA